MKLRLALAVMAVCAVGGVNAMHQSAEDRPANWDDDDTGGEERPDRVREGGRNGGGQRGRRNFNPLNCSFDIKGCFGLRPPTNKLIDRYCTAGPFTSPFTNPHYNDGGRYINSLRNQVIFFKTGFLLYVGYKGIKYLTSSKKKKKKKHKSIEID